MGTIPYRFHIAGWALVLSVCIGCGQQSNEEYSSFDEIEQPGTAPQETASTDQTQNAETVDDQKPVVAIAPKNIEEPETSPPVVAQKPDPSILGPTTTSPKPTETLADKKPTTPREVKILIPEKKFKTEGAEKALRVSYDDIDLLKVINMEPVTADAPKHMPSWLRDLDGKRIRIRGFMYPPFENTGIRIFHLARDNEICCFGKNPKIYDKFPVEMREGKSTYYILNRPFDVVGTFHISPEMIDDNLLYQLYYIDDAVVVEKLK